jgi:uncharacterized protein involved in exopolysaccharide biosynthesis
MSVGSVISGTVRALVIAAATGAAAFGLLVVFQPFGKAPPAPPAVTVSGTPAATALQQRIEAARIALRDTESLLDQADASPVSPDAASRAQYEAQIAAATERRDLSRRHAEAIRASLDAGVTPASLAGIRDSVVIGQLLAQQVALEAQIATEGARFQANHPTMRALNAQRTALVTQIRQEAANIATALEAEARIDDGQIKLLEEQLPALAAAPARTDASVLATRAAAQRAELDSLVDAYFNIPPATVTTTAPASEPANPLSALNLAIVGVAVLAALLCQVLLARRRRRPSAPAEADIAAWRADNDPEIAVADEPEPLRKAS